MAKGTPPASPSRSGAPVGILRKRKTIPVYAEFSSSEDVEGQDGVRRSGRERRATTLPDGQTCTLGQGDREEEKRSKKKAKTASNPD